MAKLVAFYSRADENYFGGAIKSIKVGNTEKVSNMISEITGAEKFKIEQKVPYSADYHTCVEQARKDKQTDARPELAFLPEIGYNINITYETLKEWEQIPLLTFGNKGGKKWQI